MVTRHPAWLAALAETLTAVCEANDVMTTVFVMVSNRRNGTEHREEGVGRLQLFAGQQRVAHRMVTPNSGSLTRW